jgi:hypothetical protein
MNKLYFLIIVLFITSCKQLEEVALVDKEKEEPITAEVAVLPEEEQKREISKATKIASQAIEGIDIKEVEEYIWEIEGALTQKHPIIPDIKHMLFAPVYLVHAYFKEVIFYAADASVNVVGQCPKPGGAGVCTGSIDFGSGCTEIITIQYADIASDVVITITGALDFTAESQTGDDFSGEVTVNNLKIEYKDGRWIRYNSGTLSASIFIKHDEKWRITEHNFSIGVTALSITLSADTSVQAQFDGIFRRKVELKKSVVDSGELAIEYTSGTTSVTLRVSTSKTLTKIGQDIFSFNLDETIVMGIESLSRTLDLDVGVTKDGRISQIALDGTANITSNKESYIVTLDKVIIVPDCKIPIGGSMKIEQTDKPTITINFQGVCSCKQDALVGDKSFETNICIALEDFRKLL